jgi:preprotein translocase subunit YajC
VFLEKNRNVSQKQEEPQMNESTASMGMMILWMVVIFGVMYFLMIRPQKKEQKRLQAMLNSMEVGDSIVTTSGFYGVIIDMTEEDVIVEFGNNKNCRIPMRKQAIAEVEKAEQASA